MFLRWFFYMRLFLDYLCFRDDMSVFGLRFIVIVFRGVCFIRGFSKLLVINKCGWFLWWFGCDGFGLIDDVWRYNGMSRWDYSVEWNSVWIHNKNVEIKYIVIRREIWAH
jgi:hypothetical protein